MHVDSGKIVDATASSTGIIAVTWAVTLANK